MDPLNLPRWILLGIAAATIALTTRGLLTGEMKRAGASHRRAEAPRDYWFEIASTVAVAIPMLFLVLLLPRHPDGHESRLFGFVLPLFLAQGVAQALWYGRTSFLGSDMLRAEKPREFWTIVIVEASLAAGILALTAYGIAATHPRA